MDNVQKTNNGSKALDSHSTGTGFEAATDYR
jgi:hypothetical protein